MPKPPAGSRRCRTCGEKVNPEEGRCRFCNSRVSARRRDSGTDGHSEATTPAERQCPRCDTDLPKKAVLCIECGYDFRTGQARTTVIKKTRDRPREPHRLSKADVAALHWVLRGLTLHNARLLLGLLAVVVVVAMVLYQASRMQKPAAWAADVLLLGSGLWMVAIAMGLLGSVFCLFVPRAARARVPLAVALYLDVIAIPLGVIVSLLGGTPLLVWGLGLVSWVLFMAYLARLARYIDRPSEAREASTILFYGLGLAAVPVVIAVLAAISAGPGDVELVIAAVLLFAGGAFLRIQFLVIRLLEVLRGSVAQRIADSRRDDEDEFDPATGLSSRW